MMVRSVSRPLKNPLVMVAIILIIMLMVPTPCISSKASTDWQAVAVVVHRLRRPHAVDNYALRPQTMVPNQHRTADRNKDAATTTTTTTWSSLQHVGEEELLNLQQFTHKHQNHRHAMLARKALMRPTQRAIAGGRLLMAASSSLAGNCDAVTVATTGRYRSWRARHLRAEYIFKLHPMKLFFVCATITTINTAAAKKTQNSHGVKPVVHGQRALKQLPPAPPLTIPSLPFTISPLPFTISPLPFRIPPLPPGLTFPPFLPLPITFPPSPVTFPPVPPLPLPSCSPPTVQKASVTMP